MNRVKYLALANMWLDFAFEDYIIFPGKEGAPKLNPRADVVLDDRPRPCLPSLQCVRLQCIHKYNFYLREAFK